MTDTDSGMLLRGTSKALKLLRLTELVIAPAGADDWYANLLWLDGRKCLLLTHADSLFPIFVADLRAAQLRPLGSWLTELIADHLRREGLPPDLLGALTSDRVRVAKTVSRHVLGVMTDMSFYIRAAVADAGGLAHCDLDQVNHQLRRGLHQRDGDYITPLELAHQRRHGSPNHDQPLR